MSLTAPCHLADSHECESFHCGVSALDIWLKDRARKNDISGASRTYVMASGNRVVAYYSLAVGSVRHEFVPGGIRRNMPDPIPIMLLARLAVDASLQGQGLGQALLRDAILRTDQAAHIAGIRAILVHALNKRAACYYIKYGFIPSPISELTLMLPLSVVRASMNIV